MEMPLEQLKKFQISTKEKQDRVIYSYELEENRKPVKKEINWIKIGLIAEATIISALSMSITALIIKLIFTK